MLTNQQNIVANIMMRRNHQIGRRRRPLEHAPRKVELRPMARAEEPALPICAHVSIRLQLRRWRTTQMCTYTFHHHQIRTDRTGRISTVLRLLARNLKIRVGQFILLTRQCFCHLISKAHYPYRLTSPLNRDHRARLDLAYIDFDGSPSSSGSSAWQHTADKRYGHRSHRNPANGGCRSNQESALGLINWLI